MGYENAPQTHMLATHCIICGKELCDAASVEAGIGPICRKKTGYVSSCTEENRVKANKHIHTVACSSNTAERIASLNALLEMDFTGVVKAMLKAVAKVKIAVTDSAHVHGAGRYAVRTPYDASLVTAMRNIKGRRWDGDTKVNTFPAESKQALFDLLCAFYEGSIAVGPKGIFQLVSKKTVEKKVA